ncbi:MAG TPA: 2'-5' RNA ligase family protein [Flavobacteriales bacterium]|nr:2'-5' RNA ligase family protein [Flavobacteriales bacterium]
MAATHRYLLVIPPSPQVSATVVAMREQLHARTGGFSGRNLMPHITLFFSDAADGLEDELVAVISAAAEQSAGFSLSYRGITHFPDRRTIYIDPTEKQCIASLRGKVAHAACTIPRIQAGLHVTDHPHLTIAAGLKPTQFDLAWSMLVPHAYAAEHAVGHLLLLKRSLLPAEPYAVIARIPLGPASSAQ